MVVDVEIRVAHCRRPGTRLQDGRVAGQPQVAAPAGQNVGGKILREAVANHQRNARLRTRLQAAGAIGNTTLVEYRDIRQHVLDVRLIGHHAARHQRMRAEARRIVQFQVSAIGLDLGDIDHADAPLRHDVGRGVREIAQGTGLQRAIQRRAAAPVARVLILLVGALQRLNGIRDLDIEYVDRGAESGQGCRLEHDAQRRGVAQLRRDIRITGLDPDGSAGGVEQQVLNVLWLAHGRRVQVIQRGCTDIARTGAAHAPGVVQMPVDPGLPRGVVAGGVVLGVANGAIQVQGLD